MSNSQPFEVFRERCEIKIRRQFEKDFENDFSKNVVFMSIVKNSKRKRHLLKKVRATFSFLLAASQYRVFKASSIFIVKLVFFNFAANFYILIDFEWNENWMRNEEPFFKLITYYLFQYSKFSHKIIQ